ncbi:MAG: bifunctional nuclease domain-containing protein [Bdellovibrionia bacterium]
MKDILGNGALGPQFIFQSQDQEEESFHQKDLIQLFPYGVSFGTDPQRPFILFKDAQHEYTLPVAISPIEAGILINQSNKYSTASNPHQVTVALLKSLGIAIQQCVFVEIKGSHQYLRIYMTGNPNTNSLKVRADEAMSLCLYLGAPIFATKTFIGKSRAMSAQLEGLAQGASLLGLADKGIVH